MNRPEITKDQRELVVELLANAVRKDAHLRSRLHERGQPSNPLHFGMTRRQSESSQRYIDGMRDVLRVLFPNGHAVAEECLEEAYALAMGVSTNGSDGRGDTFH